MGIGIGHSKRQAICRPHRQIGFDAANFCRPGGVHGFQRVTHGAIGLRDEEVEIDLCVGAIHDVAGKVQADETIEKFGLGANFVRLHSLRTE